MVLTRSLILTRSVVNVLTLVLLGAVCALGWTPHAEAKATPEEKAREAVAKLLIDHAEWCAKEGFREEGTRALSEAASLAPESPELPELKTALDGVEGEPEDAAPLEKRRRTAGPKIAKAYEKLSGVEHEAAANARFDDYLFAGFAWDADPKRAKRIVATIKKAGGNDPDEAGRLLVRLKRADAEAAAAGEYDDLEASLAKDGMLVLSSLEHPLVGYVSLPSGWKKGGSYPVLIAVDGAGSNFLGCGRQFSQSRGSRDVIVLSPITLWNTNELKPEKYPYYTPEILEKWNPKRWEFDAPGIEGLLKELRERFGAQEKCFVTGFSGGGNYCYYRLLQMPDKVAGAVPACANFGSGGVRDAPGAGEGGGPPVLLLTGENDPHKDDVFGQKPGIEGQTDNIQKELERLGYTHVEREMVKGAKHSALHGRVWQFIDEVLEGKR